MSETKNDYEKGYAAGRRGDKDPSIVEEILDQLLPGPSIFEKSTAFKEGQKDGKTDSKKK